MSESLWQNCLSILREELRVEDYNTWISLLQVVERQGEIRLMAPNEHVVEGLRSSTLPRIIELVDELAMRNRIVPAPQVTLMVGSLEEPAASVTAASEAISAFGAPPAPAPVPAPKGNRINEKFTFENFVEGKSNQFARAAAIQAAEQPGIAYNPLFIYGGVGLGKTHLMQAVGNEILARRPQAKVLYVHSERYVGDMVRALQHNAINQFNQMYRSVDALLIDDIQFFAGKDRSQEEFFHTFNALFEAEQQIVLTCDSYPREVEGLEERLRSRFGWGITVSIEPPELETSVAILKRKALSMGVALNDEVAFFIARLVRSNVRELEGALTRLVAGANFMGKPITVELTREILHDFVKRRDRQVTIDNIKKTVAVYFKIRVADLLSASRRRAITRPRQMAMALSKELTDHSLPEIGDAFGGRHHTTVMHACRKIAQLRSDDPRVEEDFTNLLRTLDG